MYASFDRKRLGILLLAVLLPLLAALAASGTASPPALPAPGGPVILEITGRIGVTNGDARARFDMAMLEGLGVTTTKTTTAWTSGQQVFEGVRMQTLLERVGAFGDQVEVVALNDYKVEIPVSDFGRWPVILAYRMNGEALRVRDKGPLWVVYPQDDFRALRTKEVQGKWAWQVKEIRVK
jgi:hypothetical protein